MSAADRQTPGSANLRRAAAIFIPVAVLATLMAGLAYVQIQHDLRSGANDPQVQLAEDTARALDGGARPEALVGTASVDIAVSLAPFILVYDQGGGVLAGNGLLEGAAPVPPLGVFASAREQSPDAITWQPRAHVRIAAVVVPWRGGSVLAGRSLRLVESREDQALQLTALGWVATLLLLLIAAVVAAMVWPAKRSSEAGP